MTVTIEQCPVCGCMKGAIDGVMAYHRDRKPRKCAGSGLAVGSEPPPAPQPRDRSEPLIDPPDDSNGRDIGRRRRGEMGMGLPTLGRRGHRRRPR